MHAIEIQIFSSEFQDLGHTKETMEEVIAKFRERALLFL